MELLNMEQAQPATYVPGVPSKEKGFIDNITSAITDNWVYILLGAGALVAIYWYMNKNSGGGGRRRRK